MHDLSFLEILETAGPRPAEGVNREHKKNYAEKLSRAIAQAFANSLRSVFPGVLPDEHGERHESRARTAKGFKKLDVNYSTADLGLALGVSIKTINFKDRKTGNYRKNYTRVDAELRAEAKDYHDRQPFSVLVAVIFLPVDACDDSTSQSPSSFGLAVKYFRTRAARKGPRDEAELFERVFLGLYEHSGPDAGQVFFFDVTNAPPKAGRPTRDTATLKDLIAAFEHEYEVRNDPPFQWADP